MRVPYQYIIGREQSRLPVPLVKVSVSSPTFHSAAFEALVDSGADDCVFPRTSADDLGIDLSSALSEYRRGVGGFAEVWIAPVTLHFGPWLIEIKACFMPGLPVAGLLGRRGFFEHFKITFDPIGPEPGMEFERVYRS